MAAVLIHKGLSVGAALSFLLAAPGASRVVFAALRTKLGAKTALVFSAAVLATSIAVGLAINPLLGRVSVPDLHAIAAAEPSVFEISSGALLGALLIASLLRLGPREWLRRISVDLSNPHIDCHESRTPHVMAETAAARAAIL